MDIFELIEQYTNTEKTTVKNTFKSIDTILSKGINKNTIYRVEDNRKRVKGSASNTSQRLISR